MNPIIRRCEHDWHEIVAIARRYGTSAHDTSFSVRATVALGGRKEIALTGPDLFYQADAEKYLFRLIEAMKTILDRVTFPERTEFERQSISEILHALPHANGELAQWCGWRDDDLRDGKQVVHALCDDGSPWCEQGKPLDTGDGKCHTTRGNMDGTLGMVTCPVCRMHFEV